MELTPKRVSRPETHRHADRKRLDPQLPIAAGGDCDRLSERPVCFRTGRWRHDFLDERPTGSGRAATYSVGFVPIQIPLVAVCGTLPKAVSRQYSAAAKRQRSKCRTDPHRRLRPGPTGFVGSPARAMMHFMACPAPPDPCARAGGHLAEPRQLARCTGPAGVSPSRR